MHFECVRGVLRNTDAALRNRDAVLRNRDAHQCASH